MGAAASHPVYQSPDTMVCIRNLSITPLELKEAERLPKPTELLSHTTGLANITTRLIARRTTASRAPSPTDTQQPPENAAPTKQQITGILLRPFSESPTPVLSPDISAGEQVRLTFEDPATGDRYAASFPGATPQSIVMRPLPSPSSAPESPSDKEFTLIYLPRVSYLTILSSANLPAWMSTIPSTVPLSSLSIPGTHNSPTYFKALPSVRCQAVSIRNQLDNGIRFLDIRVSCPDESLHDSDLALVHSAFPISLSGSKWFHDLLADVYAYLDAHPSETILMSIKREGTGRGTDETLSKYLAGRYFAGEAARRWYISSKIPTLGEARGKIVLIRRFHLDESLREKGMGIDGSVWPDNCADGTCGSGLIRIQDFYEVGQTEQIHKKIELARAELERSAQQMCRMPGSVGSENEMPFFINFLSASSFFNASCWPDRIAAKINPSIIEYLCTGHGAPGKGPEQLTVGDAGTGVVVIDWVGNNGDWDIVRSIVAWNARLQLKA